MRLIDKIQEGYTKKRNHTAESEYITWRSRTIYTVVKDIPEENGLTLEDYFQIGCETVLIDARTVDKTKLLGDKQRTATLTAHIRRDIRRAHLATGGKTEPQEMIATPHIATVDMYKDMDAPEEAEIAGGNLIVEEMLQILEPREQSVLKHRYGFNKLGKQYTLEEVARTHGVTRERVRQIETNALKKLQGAAMYENNSLSQYRRSDEDTFMIDSGLSEPVHALSPDEFAIAKRLGFRASQSWGYRRQDDPNALPTIGDPLRTSLGVKLAVAKRRRQRMVDETLDDIFRKPPSKFI